MPLPVYPVRMSIMNVVKNDSRVTPTCLQGEFLPDDNTSLLHLLFSPTAHLTRPIFKSTDCAKIGEIIKNAEN